MAGPVVLNVKAATFTLAADQASLATGQAFSCQITRAVVTAQPKLTTVPATMCSAESQSAAASGFQLEIGYLQDWTEDTPASLSRFLFDNDGTQQAFQIDPTDPDMPTISGDCWVVAGDYGGDMGTNLVATATMPCLAKPTVGTGTLLAAGTEGQAQPVQAQQTQPQPPMPPQPPLQPAGVA